MRVAESVRRRLQIVLVAALGLPPVAGRSWAEPPAGTSPSIRRSIEVFTRQYLEEERPQAAKSRSVAAYRRLLIQANDLALLAPRVTPGTESVEGQLNFIRESLIKAIIERDRLARITGAGWPTEVAELVLDHKIRHGMAMDQVLLAWGWPSDVVTDGAAGKERWTYNGQIVEFADGKVTRIEKTRRR